MAFKKDDSIFLPALGAQPYNGGKPYVHSLITHVHLGGNRIFGTESYEPEELKQLKDVIDFLDKEIKTLKQADEHFRNGIDLYTCADAITKYQNKPAKYVDMNKITIRYSEIVLQIIGRSKYNDILKRVYETCRADIRDAVKNVTGDKTVWEKIGKYLPKGITEITKKDLIYALRSGLFYDNSGNLRRGTKNKLNIDTKMTRSRFEISEIFKAIGFVDDEYLKDTIDRFKEEYLAKKNKHFEKQQKSTTIHKPNRHLGEEKVYISATLPNTQHESEFEMMLSTLADMILDSTYNYPNTRAQAIIKLQNLFCEYLRKDFIEEVEKLGIGLYYEQDPILNKKGEKKKKIDLARDEITAKVKVKQKQTIGRIDQGEMAANYIEEVIEKLKNTKVFERIYRNLWLRDKSEVIIPIFFETDVNRGFSMYGSGAETEKSNVGRVEDEQYMQSELEKQIGRALKIKDLKLKKTRTIQSDTKMSLTDFFLVNYDSETYARVQSKNIYNQAPGIEGDVSRQNYGKSRAKETITIQKYLEAIKRVGGNPISRARIIQNYLQYWAGNLAFFVNTAGSLRHDVKKNERQSIYEQIKQSIADIIGINTATILGANTQDIDIIDKGLDEISSYDYSSAVIYYWMRDQYLVPVWTILDGIRWQLDNFYQPLVDQIFTHFGAQNIVASGISIPKPSSGYPLNKYAKSKSTLIQYARAKRPSGIKKPSEKDPNRPYTFDSSPGYELAEKLYPQVRLTNVSIDFNFDLLQKSAMVFRLIEKE